MKRKWSNANLSKRARRIVATATAFTFLCQNFAWAVCADGSTFPAGGFVFPQPPTATWSQGVFTASGGSVFVPDNSIFEHNDPGQPVTGGGHNWVFDASTDFCKAIDIGPAGGTPTGWTLTPPTSPLLPSADCFGLTPRILVSGAGVVNATVGQGEAITPTCNPALLSQPGAPNPANTRLNQLGCAISHGVATTPNAATTFVFVPVTSPNTSLIPQNGLVVVQLANVANPSIGGDAGKIVGPFDVYSDIPAGQKLTGAAVSPDGMFAIATSSRRVQSVFACLNPLGDPGDPSLPIDPNFSIPPASQVKCMSVGSNGLLVDLATAFGPDNQPYFGGRASASGQSSVNSFNADPGGSAPTAWPQCIFFATGFTNLQAVFNAHIANHCGSARPNIGFPAATVVQPQAIISHASYMYAGSLSGTVVQIKVTVDPLTGLSQYASRTYLSGLSSFITGLGVADDLQSLMTFTDPSGIGMAGQEVIVKAPLCEDM